MVIFMLYKNKNLNTFRLPLNIYKINILETLLKFTATISTKY